MACEKCGREASMIYVTKLVDGVLREMRLCETCLREEGTLEQSEIQPANHMLSALLDAVNQSPLQVGWIKTTSCSRCGMTYGLFRELGKMGCSDCYSAFIQKIEPVLYNWHGHKKHVGKRPIGEMAGIEVKAKRQKLMADLELAIIDEQFEQAAKIRDALLAIERGEPYDE